MSKNAFEVRADVLAMAKDYLDRQAEANIAYATEVMRINQSTSEGLQDYFKMYSIDDLLKQTNKLYEFVNTKK